ncbi:MAG: DoxX family membrane protein [Acidobacteriota bacterium]
MRQAAIGNEPKADSTIDGVGVGSEPAIHPLQRLLVRFAWIYLIGYGLPNAWELAFRANPFAPAMHRLAIWAGENVLKMNYDFRADSESGDAMMHYLTVLILFVVAFVGSLVWTLVDREPSRDRRLGRWLFVACRFYLLGVMVAYGLAKIFTLQFVPPSLERLLQTYGTSSPMGLHTTAMGYGKAYAVFGGLAELVGGLLLAYRRTTTLGALILVGVMSNVVVMNFAYDVSVKLFSLHILLFACALLVPDARRLLHVFVFNRPAPAAAHPPLFGSQRARLVGRAMAASGIGLFLLTNVATGFASEKALGRGAAKPPLWGIYDVESFYLDGELRPPLLTDASRWQNVVFDTLGRLSVRRMDGGFQRYSAVVDGPGKLSIYPQRGTRELWIYEQPAPGKLLLAGELDRRKISVEAKARALGDIPLIRGGFRWVNEVTPNF